MHRALHLLGYHIAVVVIEPSQAKGVSTSISLLSSIREVHPPLGSVEDTMLGRSSSDAATGIGFCTSKRESRSVGCYMIDLANERERLWLGWLCAP